METPLLDQHFQNWGVSQKLKEDGTEDKLVSILPFPFHRHSFSSDRVTMQLNRLSSLQNRKRVAELKCSPSSSQPDALLQRNLTFQGFYFLSSLLAPWPPFRSYKLFLSHDVVLQYLLFAVVVFILLCGPNKVIWENTVVPFMFITFSSCLSLGSDKLILSVDFMYLQNPCTSSIYRFLQENMNQIFQKPIIVLKISQILYQLDYKKEGFLKYRMIPRKKAQHLKLYILHI